MRLSLKVSFHHKTKPNDITGRVNDVVAYMDVGKGREQDAEALCREKSVFLCGEICLTCD